MAMVAGSVIARFKSDLKDFKKGIGQAKSGVEGVGQSFKKVGGQMQRTGGIMTAAITLPLIGLGTGAVKAASGFEQTTVAFETMLGSAERATKLLNDLTTMAVKTPFEVGEIEMSAKQLLAMGIEVDKLIPTLKAMGDVSAGLSVDLNRVAYNFGQVKAQGHLTGVELRDFARAGVPVISELAQNLGVAESAIKEMVSAGEIGFAEVEEAFTTMSSEGGRFANLMDKQSKTTAGKISDLKDSITILARTMGQELLPAVTKIVDKLADFVERLNNMNPRTRKLVISAGLLAAALGPVIVILGTLISSIGTIAAAVGGLAAAIGIGVGALLGIVAIIAAVIAIGVLLYKNWGTIKTKAIEIFEAIKSTIVDFYENTIKPIFEGIKTAFRQLWQNVIKPVIDKVVAYWKFWASIFKWVWKNIVYPLLFLMFAVFTRIFYEIWKVIKKIMEWIWDKITAVWNAIWGFLEPILKKIGAFISDKWKWIKGITAKIWQGIKEKIITPMSEVWKSIKETVGNIYNGIKTKFNEVLSSVRDTWGKIKDAIINPFRQAKEKVEEIAEKIKEVARKISPFHKESPSLVDQVEKGVARIKSAYGELGSFGISPVAKVGVGAGGQTVVVNLNNPNITGPEVAEDYAVQIGDKIVDKFNRLKQ